MNAKTNFRKWSWLQLSKRWAAQAGMLPPVLLQLALPGAVEAQFTFTTNNGTNAITGYTGPRGAVVTPDTIDEFPVTSIGAWAFQNKTNLSTLAAVLSATNTAYTTITVRVNGGGSVTPNYNGRLLKVGSSLTLSWKPAPGYVWAGWTSNLSEGTHYNNTFSVEPGLELVANFVPNPFPAIQGEYAGLVFETNEVQHDHAGYFSLNLTGRGGYSGKILIGGHSYSLGGFGNTVTADGHVQEWLFLFKGDAFDFTMRHVLTADFQFDLTNGTDQVCGTVSDRHLDRNQSWVPATWVAQITGSRAAFNSRTNPAPQAGAYTVIFPGGDGTNEPAGMGFAAVNVDSGGHVRMSGFLADGTAITQRTAISKDGRWPLFANVYSGHGSVLGWLVFSNQPDSAVAGTVVWTRPALASAKLYPAGFGDALEVVGSRYARPPGGTPWNFTNGMVVFANGGLSAAFTNTFACNQTGRITSTSGKKFNLKAISATGLFYGNANVPETGTTIKFKGAVLQNQNRGYGYFLEMNQSWTVTLEED